MLRSLTCLLLTLPAVAAPLQEPGDLDTLLDDIASVTKPGSALPGEVLAFGEDAFVVASASDKAGARGVIAATRCGEGRAVAFGHNAFLGGEPGSDRLRLAANALAWSADERARKVDVFVVGQAPAGLDDLVGEVTAGRGVPGLLDDYDAILWRDGDPDAAGVERLVAFVEGGGGLVFGVCPWGRQQLYGSSGRSIRTDLPHSQVAQRLGLAFGFDTVGAAAYELDPEPNALVHAGRAVEAALATLTGQPTWPGHDPAATARLTGALLRALPADEQLFGPRLRAVLTDVDLTPHVPGPGRKVPRSDARGHLGMLLATMTWKEAAPDAIPAAPGHGHFPGSVPTDAERLSRRVVVEADAVIPGAWQSTGLYAPAGEVVSAVSEASGWELRIGAHKDLLWHKDKWSRWPEVTKQEPLGAESEHPSRAAATTHHANPFGGLIYLVPTGKAPRTTTGFVIDGAVEAPLFVHDDDESAADWERRRQAPAPWGELVCDGVVITVPAGALRDLDDPAALMDFWSEAMACYPELLGEPLHPTGRPERLVEDIQISAGWMHSGYPVMTHGAERLDHSNAADLATLSTKGDWGYFHEFGHNAQDGRWTFAGTGEVTCNLFSLYLGERMAGIEPWNNPWLNNQKAKLQPHLAAGAPFDTWKSQPGLALLLYALVQRDHGWEPIAAALQSYHDGVRTPSDQAKRDEWLKRLSRATGKDLGPYFEAMGVPTSAAARREVGEDEALDPWLPAELTP